MELPENYRQYLSSLRGRLERVGFGEPDFNDIAENELMFELSRIESLNSEVRSIKAFWSLEQTEAGYWPDDQLIIGGRGNGDYYFISKSGAFSGVRSFSHECLEVEEYARSLDDYFDKTMEIMRSRIDENT
jgi:hypothetical protein